MEYVSYAYIFLSIIILIINIAKSEVYIVGDDDEWNSQVDYASWSQNYNFTVGDVLVFKYAKGQHNTYEVTETAFRTCDPTGGVIARYETGDDHVRLTEPKQYWFICHVSGHCLGGMRFGIRVAAGSGANLPRAEPVAQPPGDDASCGTRHRFGDWVLSVFLTVGFVLLLKNRVS